MRVVQKDLLFKHSFLGETSHSKTVSQPKQEVAPGAAYVPDAHAVHGVPASPSTSAYPAAQSTQPRVEASVKEPGAEYVPAKQLVHGVDALLSSSFVPAAHCIHDVAPTAE